MKKVFFICLVFCALLTGCASSGDKDEKGSKSPCISSLIG